MKYSHRKAMRVDVIIGSFENNSDYMRGLFTAGSDKLGNQAHTILNLSEPAVNKPRI
jgi:curli biogenesis system outer membrane secretion channel CsgG